MRCGCWPDIPKRKLFLEVVDHGELEFIDAGANRRRRWLQGDS